MSQQIVSAGIKKHGALINEDGRQLCASESAPSIEIHAEKGLAFYIVSGFVDLTTSGESGILYVKNDSPSLNLHLHSVRTCGKQATEWRMIRNPSAGTLISAGTAKTPVNLDFSSKITCPCTVMAGSEGKTVTDGDEAATWIDHGPGHSASEVGGSIILGPGDTIAIMCAPDSAARVCSTWLCYMKKPEALRV